MKVFLNYNPQKIATYVKILFKGKFYIKGIGAFEFDMGKILPPKIKDQQYFSVMSEVNRQLLQLQAEY